MSGSGVPGRNEKYSTKHDCFKMREKQCYVVE